jgi:hypothetical protein
MGTTKGPGPSSERTTVRRLPQRAVYDRTEIAKILDEGLVCHVGLIESGFPRLIPMAYVRIDDRIIVHGSRASRLLRALAEGAEACVAVTLLDGLVLARADFPWPASANGSGGSATRGIVRRSPKGRSWRGPTSITDERGAGRGSRKVPFRARAARPGRR